MTEETVYVGELIRKTIKDKHLTNGFVISRLAEDGIEMTDAKFSNKIYGQRDKFTDTEVEKISTYLGVDFKINTQQVEL